MHQYAGIIRARSKSLSFIASALAVVASITATLATAQEGWRQNGTKVEHDRSKASSPNGFAILQIATLDPNGFSARWNQPDAGVEVAQTTSVARKQPVVTFIIFTGCAPDPAGNCNVTADFKMFDPSGHSFGQQLGSHVWVGMPPPPKDHLQLSATALGMVVEDKDSLGNYRIVATVTDHVSGVILSTEQTIVAKPAI